MNTEVYVFGKLSSGFSIYPDDSSSYVFKTFEKQSQAPTQVCIHRNGPIMYYGYVRKLEGNKLLGLCISVNGYYTNQINELFIVFERIVEDMCDKGIFLCYDSNGNITIANIYSFEDEKEEFILVSRSLKEKFETLAFHILPPPDYSISIDSIKVFNKNEGNSNIAADSCRFAYCFVYKESDYDSIRVNNRRAVIKKLQEEKQSLNNEIGELKQKLAKISRQKKQFRNVIVLIITILILGAGLFFVNDNLNNTKVALNNAQDIIKVIEDSINSLNIQISDNLKRIAVLTDDLTLEKGKYKNTLKELNSLKDTITNNHCFYIKSTRFNNFTGNLTFNYLGFEDKTVNITIKAYGPKPNDPVFTKDERIEILKGNHTASIYISKDVNRALLYHFIIEVGYDIVGGTVH